MEVGGLPGMLQDFAGGESLFGLPADRNAGVNGLGVLTGRLGREEPERHPHSWVLDGVEDLPSVLESALVSQ